MTPGASAALQILGETWVDEVITGVAQRLAAKESWYALRVLSRMSDDELELLAHREATGTPTRIVEEAA